MNIQDNLNLSRDENQRVRIINHNQEPVSIRGAETPERLAEAYFNEVAKIYDIDDLELKSVNLKPTRNLVDEKAAFRIDIERINMGSVIIAYSQTYFGLPVWEAAFNIVIQENPLQVLSSSSTAYHDIEVKKPSAESLKRAEGIIDKTLPKNLFEKTKDQDQRVKINRRRLIVYKYDASKRIIEPREEGNQGFERPLPTLPLPPVSDKIKDGNFYVVEEILFTMAVPGWWELNWRAFVEVETSSVLYLRALVACADAQVFATDPMTKTGNAAHIPSATAATLDPDRTLVTLAGLVPPVMGVQSLSGNYVTLTDVSPPSTFPTTTMPFQFQYSSRTDSFAAANAYHHCDGFFRMMEDMGFNVGTYFNNTTFPVTVDHAIGNFINAFCNGNGGGNGIGNVIFALSDTTDLVNPLGIAADWRVVCHEIGGHGILWDNANSANFGFAHSAGDSVGAILNDPGSLAPDRFETFPFTFLSLPAGSRRFHNRPVAGGWGWGGANDTNGYNSEQILATTLFRLYRSMGGDAASLNSKKFAARFAVYLIFRSVGLVTPGSTPNALNFEVLMESADAFDWVSTNPSETHDGGAYHKVIRWAFEKQGLFRAVGDPNTSEGRPPAVDVYIDDGRAGEYQYLANHWSCTDIWNRLSIGEGGGVHQEPIVGATNYAYVRIKNRGGQLATNVVVKGFHCLPGVGLVYPNDWVAMTTPQLPAPDIAANDNVGIVVGPFEWTPSQVGHECMFFSVSAGTDDVSNIDGRVSGPIPEWRLIPHDNNIGQRNVSPVPPLWGGLQEYIKRHPFWVNNPFERRVKIKLTPVLPRFLTELGWELTFANAGGGSFSLYPGMTKKIDLAMKAGREFDKETVERNKEDNTINIYAYADGMLMGGMAYQFDTSLKELQPTKEETQKCDKIAKELLDCVHIPNQKIKSIQIKRITLNIDFETDDDC